MMETAERQEEDMIILKEEDYQKILDHAAAGLPNEACGLLGGYEEEGNRIVTDVYLLRNVDESREHFSMDPVEQFAIIKDIRSKGRQLLGNFHSHPESPSRPSAIYTVTVKDNSRAMSANDLADCMKSGGFAAIPCDNICDALEKTADFPLCVICGSLYLYKDYTERNG